MSSAPNIIRLYNESMSSSSTITVATIVACFLSKYSDEEPQLGKVVTVNEKTLK